MEYSLRQRLSRPGMTAPTKCWEGSTPVVAAADPQWKDLLIATVLEHLFGKRSPTPTDEYVEVDFDTGVALAALALRPPFLGVLAMIGREDSMICPAGWPAAAETDAVRATLYPRVGRSARCITNFNETGAWFEVDPGNVELCELLLIFSGLPNTVAVYWSEPID